MTTTAPDLDLARTARLFHALSDETRLAVLDMLRQGERCVCELQDDLEAAQSRLSFHLKVLKDAGLVTDRKDGRWSYYSINPEALDELDAHVASLRPMLVRLERGSRMASGGGSPPSPSVRKDGRTPSSSRDCCR